MDRGAEKQKASEKEDLVYYIYVMSINHMLGLLWSSKKAHTHLPHHVPEYNS
jgi:hypothetical protein